MSNLMKIENLLATQQKEKQQHVLHAYCDEENSRSESPASLKIAAEITRQLMQKCLRRVLSCSLEDL